MSPGCLHPGEVPVVVPSPLFLLVMVLLTVPGVTGTGTGLFGGLGTSTEHPEPPLQGRVCAGGRLRLSFGCGAGGAPGTEHLRGWEPPGVK